MQNGVRVLERPVASRGAKGSERSRAGKQVPRALKTDLADDPKTLVVGRIGSRGCAKTLGLMTSPNHTQSMRALVCFGLYGGSAFRLVSMPCVFAYEAGGGYASVQSFEQLDHVLAAATRYCHFSRRSQSFIRFLSRGTVRKKWFSS
jgi:hypothetical protein